MKDDLRLKRVKYFLQTLTFTDITEKRFSIIFKQMKMCRGFHRQGNAAKFCSEPGKPEAQPRTFESGMAGDETPAFAVNSVKHLTAPLSYFQNFVQGAAFSFHISLSMVCSLGVSMHCQNPS